MIDPVDAYIAEFPADIQQRLASVRETIRQAAPDASEKISYRIPTFFLNGNLVHFAAFKNHIGIYPGAKAIEVFSDELTAYRTGKGSIQFPFDQPLPLALIDKIVRFCVNEQRR